MENETPIEERLQALHNWTTHVRRMTPQELDKLDANIRKVEALINRKRDRRQAQVDIIFEDRRHGERRGEKKD